MLSKKSGMKFLFALSMIVVCLTGTGCGKFQTAPVSGVITLDDKPLEDATVTFTPAEAIDGEIIMSSGRTDTAGKYTLELLTNQKPGAVVGKHAVRIARNIDSESDIMTEAEAQKNYLPAHDFSFEVVSGSNQADFNLESRSGKR